MDEKNREPRRGSSAESSDAPIDRASTVVVSPDQVSTSVGDEAVILGAQAGQYFGLSDVGARVWELVQTPHDVAAICAQICAEYDVAADTCERDVIALLEELREKGLVDVRPAPGTR